jgi:hypothetical protein
MTSTIDERVRRIADDRVSGAAAGPAMMEAVDMSLYDADNMLDRR